MLKLSYVSPHPCIIITCHLIHISSHLIHANTHSGHTRRAQWRAQGSTRASRSPNRGAASPAAPNAPRRLNPANAHRLVPLYCSPVSIDNCAQLAASRPARPSRLHRATTEGRGGGQTGVRVRDGVGRKRLSSLAAARERGRPPANIANIQYARFAVGRLSGSRRAAWRPRSVTTIRRWSRDSPE